MDKPKYETGFIKCYKRPSKSKDKSQYQRRILLKSDGELQGCNENKDPLNVAVVQLEVWDRTINIVEDSELRKTALKEQVDECQSTIEKLKKEHLEYTERTNQINEKNQNEINNLKATIKEINEDRDRLQGTIQSNEKILNSKLDQVEKALQYIGYIKGKLEKYQGKRSWYNRIYDPYKELREVTPPAPELVPIEESKTYTLSNEKKDENRNSVSK